MIITSEELHAKWLSADFTHGGYIQIGIKHPLEWHLGYENIDSKSLVIVSEAEPELLDSSKSIEVAKRIRISDGRWTWAFILMRKDQESVYETLCADIINFSSGATDETNALAEVSKRFKQWNRLLEHQRKALMDESRRKGLFGELLFLNSILDRGITPIIAIQGWVGPDGADQDFVYSDGWHEIKTVGLSANSISISSLEQLKCEDNGEIVVMRVDKCAPKQSGARSLSEMVDFTANRFSIDGDASALFESKLARYGFIDLPEYREQKYKFSYQERYCVKSDFPKLTAVNVPEQVVSAQYSISLAGIADWKMEE